MLAAMLNLDAVRKSFLLIVIEPENLARMRQADPATLESINNGGVLPIPRYPENFSVLVAYDEDEAELYWRAQGDPREFLRYLERGRRFDPAVDGKEKTVWLRREVE